MREVSFKQTAQRVAESLASFDLHESFCAVID
jgi:hypothetical protein